MKCKYESTDIRTGYDVGSLVELTEKELAKLPFNVKMKFVENVEEKTSKKTNKGDK